MKNGSEQFLDLPEGMREAAKKHGREMIALVHSSAMATEAVRRLVGRGQGLRDQEILHAAKVLADSFNHVSTALCLMKGWDEAMLVQCEKDVSLGMRPVIVLPH